MKIEITDEMVRKTEATLDETFCLKATLEAIAPIIADQVLERVCVFLAQRAQENNANLIPLIAAIRALKEPTP